ncbi:transglycosylase SLT domain-containing protein [Aquicoccus sp. G2-2]|uniref:transglycosylase SLT domain-containing protein n=1 Tax=Aquicoccus sp. G2-2 TaxID=3092120 RepID=UPI002ADF989F|nr:transglycosylase SLT domain-containing protein [Aquicoccus sp. G2-2]MEA1112667.1 transglycosylase SLT domain-containing protein [Aquicoccus sp. G2-2]
MQRVSTRTCRRADIGFADVLIFTVFCVAWLVAGGGAVRSEAVVATTQPMPHTWQTKAVMLTEDGAIKRPPLLRAAGIRRVLRPRARTEALPHARWSSRPEARLWTRAALSAMKGPGRPLVRMVPGDIQSWCPAYPMAGPDQRAAFWVGFMSALSKHESTYRPDAVGGGGLWYGLLQILPSTARLYKCRARSGAALKDGPANLSCAIRIMARTVPRDGVINAHLRGKKRSWRGVSADWGPMRSAAKRRDMERWLKQQSYCKPMHSIRPHLRPDTLVKPVVADAETVDAARSAVPEG